MSLPFPFKFHQLKYLPDSLQSLSPQQLLLLSFLALPIFIFLTRTLFTSNERENRPLDEDDPDASDLGEGNNTSTVQRQGVGSESSSESESEVGGGDTDSEKKTSIMSPENPELAPPSDKPFTLEELKPFDGSDPSKPIYVSIKGTVFDVTSKREMYGPGKSYNVFAGKDGSRGLGMSSLKEGDAVPDYSTLPPNERKVLDDWHAFFMKRYNIVGRVVDMPEAVANANANASSSDL